jgi:spermidine synthase
VRDRDRPRAWTLLIDQVPQSHVDLDDPEHLEFEYIRRIGRLLDATGPAGQPLRVLHLGAGGLTLARYVAATRPRSSQLAVDDDPALVDLVRVELPFTKTGRAGHPTGIRVRIGDARRELESLRPDSFDVVIADAFSDGRTPASLTSAEFMTAARNALRDAGVLALNVADGPPLTHARAQVATVRSVFPHACLIADTGVLRGRRFGNLVLAASRQELPIPPLTRLIAADPLPARLLDDEDLAKFAIGAKPVTDATAHPSPEPPADLFRGERGKRRKAGGLGG